MTLARHYIKQLKGFNSNLENIAKSAVKENEKEILKILQDDQLGKGYDSLGEDLIHPTKRSGSGVSGIPKYEPVTEFFWAKKSPFPITPKKTGERYNFVWTGKTKNTMSIVTDKEGFTILSATKTALEGLYQTKLMALTPENLKFITEKYIEPFLLDNFLSNFEL